ncbi:MAG: nucleoside phosphorylase [Thaumarchaeota archaeon]|nr:nucleoside phosphorylase [Nitrososphaerota archaeon]
MTQEPLDEKGRPYHIRLEKRQVGSIAFLPGDPARVARIAQRLTRPEQLSSNREFTAYGGYVGKERIVVISTGIGGPATAIVVEELARLGVRTMIRVGTCGAITSRAKVGSVIIADAAVRMDGTSALYVQRGYPAAATPGIVMALSHAARKLKVQGTVGIAASTDSFYVGQGRKGFGGYFPPESAGITKRLQQARVLCFEMEAATLFTLGRLFGLQTGAVFAVVANRATNEFKLGSGIDAAIDVAVGSVRHFKKYGV